MLKEKIKEFTEKYGCPEDVNPFLFEKVMFAGKVPVSIFKFRQMKHNFVEGWETEYLKSLFEVLKYEQTVYDIGAEQGEFTAFAGHIVGGGNVHIFEPSPDYWPNIKMLWEENKLDTPFCFNGFVSSKSDGGKHILSWPECANGEIFIDTNHILSHDTKWGDIGRITIDHYSEISKSIPDVLMIDVEGAEVDVVIGAEKTLKNNNVVLFVSVHSEDCISQYGHTKEELFNIMSSYGYVAEHIYTDHEEHWKFFKL